MAWSLFKSKKQQAAETRNAEDPTVPISAENFLQFFGVESMGQSAAGVTVTLKNALEVTAVFAAVNFIAGTVAGLPLKLYKKTESGREESTGTLADILHYAVNDETSSFDWRKYSMERVLTGGRSYTFIERNIAGRIINLWPLKPSAVTVYKRQGKTTYHYLDGKRPVIYEAKEIIDISFMLDDDGITTISPILKNADTIGLALAVAKYGSRFFNNGGIPPFAVEGSFSTSKGMKNASADIESAIKEASQEGRQVLTLPSGHKIHGIGVDPQKSQMTETRHDIVVEVARIYSLPPTFLQDLTNGTFSNTEQQDLHFVKHTIKR